MFLGFGFLVLRVSCVDLRFRVHGSGLGIPRCGSQASCFGAPGFGSSGVTKIDGLWIEGLVDRVSSEGFRDSETAM